MTGFARAPVAARLATRCPAVRRAMLPIDRACRAE
jgi:hypothetical protein